MSSFYGNSLKPTVDNAVIDNLTVNQGATIGGAIKQGTGNTTSVSLSVALGKNNTTSASYSIANGSSNTASGSYSIANGVSNVASGPYAVAIGNQAKDLNQNTASGESSFALGSSNTASGSYSVAQGSQNVSSGQFAIACGQQNKTSGLYSLAHGGGNTVTASYSSAFGNNNKISSFCSGSPYSFATGISNRVLDQCAFASGAYNRVDSQYGQAFGVNNNTVGQYALTGGANSIGLGEFGLSYGYGSLANGYSSINCCRSVESATATAQEDIEKITVKHNDDGTCITTIIMNKKFQDKFKNIQSAIGFATKDNRRRIANATSRVETIDGIEKTIIDCTTPLFQNKDLIDNNIEKGTQIWWYYNSNIVRNSLDISNKDFTRVEGTPHTLTFEHNTGLQFGTFSKSFIDTDQGVFDVITYSYTQNDDGTYTIKLCLNEEYPNPTGKIYKVYGYEAHNYSVSYGTWNRIRHGISNAAIGGEYNESKAKNSLTIGSYNINSTPNSLVLGQFNQEQTDKLIIAGYGTALVNRKNVYTLDTSGNGVYSGTVEASSIILKSPNRDKWQISVDNDGKLTTTKKG